MAVREMKLLCLDAGTAVTVLRPGATVSRSHLRLDLRICTIWDYCFKPRYGRSSQCVTRRRLHTQEYYGREKHMDHRKGVQLIVTHYSVLASANSAILVKPYTFQATHPQITSFRIFRFAPA